MDVKRIGCGSANRLAIIGRRVNQDTGLGLACDRRASRLADIVGPKALCIRDAWRAKTWNKAAFCLDTGFGFLGWKTKRRNTQSALAKSAAFRWRRNEGVVKDSNVRYEEAAAIGVECEGVRLTSCCDIGDDLLFREVKHNHALACDIEGVDGVAIRGEDDVLDVGFLVGRDGKEGLLVNIHHLAVGCSRRAWEGPAGCIVDGDTVASIAIRDDVLCTAVGECAGKAHVLLGDDAWDAARGVPLPDCETAIVVTDKRLTIRAEGQIEEVASCGVEALAGWIK